MHNSLSLFLFLSLSLPSTAHDRTAVRSRVSAGPHGSAAQLAQTNPVLLSRLVLRCVVPPQILLASSGARHTLLLHLAGADGPRQNHRALEHAFKPFLDAWVVQGLSDGDRNRPNLAVGGGDTLLELHLLYRRQGRRRGRRRRRFGEVAATVGVAVIIIIVGAAGLLSPIAGA